MSSNHLAPPAGPRTAKGAALLAFMLALIAGSAWLLLSDLNRHTQAQTRRNASGLALNEAKRALLSYAMNYPDLRSNPQKGPGFLPCPDRNNDGRPESNCALTTGTTLGRLPFAILGLDDPRDSSGERLWYAVSPGFRNVQSNHTVINSETPGQLSVDGTGDLVALVLAPGAPGPGQFRRPSNRAADYLEAGNAEVADGRFSASAGNDQVAVIQRAELMAAVERRVLSDVRSALARYRARHAAYPRAAPFADPHADGQALRGFHSGSDNAARLIDRRRDFIEWGVRAYDRVRNVTDGSIAVVKTVRRHALELYGLATGLENDFDRGDSYFIELRGLARRLTGTAGPASAGLVLKDPQRDFRDAGVLPGAVVENLSDGSSGTVASVERTALTLDRLSGGVENDFDAGERYRLRSNTGTAGPGAANLTLADPLADFIARGLVKGDLVENLSDGSVGRIDKVAGPTLLTVAGLDFGRTNGFSQNDVYRLPRYNAGTAVRKGLLPVHEPGKRFPTGFGVEWRIVGSGRRVITGFASDTHAGYALAVTQALESSAAAGASGVQVENGYCSWLNARVVDCAGLSAPAPLLAGRMASGSTATVLVDDDRDFIAAGIKPGDLVEAPHLAVVTRVASSSTLRVRQLAGASRSPVRGEAYRLRLATRLLTGVVGSSSAARLQDPDQDFGAAGVRPGDVVENTTDGSFGLVAGVNGSTLSASLYGGQGASFRQGDGYRVYYGYVNQRRYRFRLRYQGNAATRSSAGVRQRDVCRGYGIDCTRAPTVARLPWRGSPATARATAGTTARTLEDAGADFLQHGVVPGDTLFNATDGSWGMVAAVGRHTLTVSGLEGGRDNVFEPGEGYRVGAPLVTIEDLRDASVVTRVGLTVLPGGAPGSIRTSGMDYYLSEEAGELPPWFTKNKWQRLVYIAYGAGFAAGGPGHCAVGVDCLVLQGRSVAGEALVVSAGMALAGQDRATGSIADYYEGANASLSADDTFSDADRTGSFNDQVALAAP